MQDKLLCDTCLRFDLCRKKSERTTECADLFTLEDKVRIQQQQDDLVFIVKTKQGARMYIDRINRYVFDTQPFTGNSQTHYNLGERGLVMSELLTILNVLDLDTYTDLVIYLNNIIKGATK